MRMRYVATARGFMSLLAMTPLFAGCTVGPDFVSPHADVPQSWTDTALPKGAKDNAPNPFNANPADEAAWWANFHDATLSSLIARAAAANLDVREAALRISEARSQRAIAAADQWPTLSGNASYARQG